MRAALRALPGVPDLDGPEVGPIGFGVAWKRLPHVSAQGKDELLLQALIKEIILPQGAIFLGD